MQSQQSTFNEQDLEQIRQRGSDPAAVQQQIDNFKNGFPALTLKKAATPGDGVQAVEPERQRELITRYEASSKTLTICKFVPASGAASRMFKDLYSYLDGGLMNQATEKFIANLERFAFYEDLKAAMAADDHKLQPFLETGEYRIIIDYFLNDHGLGYGELPKGLLKFHRYDEGARTPVEEHLTEGAHYAVSSGNVVHIHFTVSKEHRQRFEEHVDEVKQKYEEKYGVRFVLSFSEQKPHTDTIAVTMSNEPFRNDDGTLLFRPAGHGALLENLNDIEADLIFIKNIDNVVPDKLKGDTYTYKKLLGGMVLEVQKRIFEFQQWLDGNTTKEQLDRIEQFYTGFMMLQNIPEFNDDDARKEFYTKKCFRPVRATGIVINEGEPGGGPFFAENPDGTVSIQIAETAQIDHDNEEQAAIAQSSTHFSPTDLVCAVKDYRGRKYDLRKYTDPKTGFISTKSKDGRELKAQELPGLWNGSMSDWNTVFVEVPTTTFNPVKVINDLLRDQHQ